MELYPEEIDLAALVRDVAGVAPPLVGKNGNVLRVECPEGLGEMRTDLTTLRQILLNLLSNAAKFTRGGAITLTANRQLLEGREWWRFAVRTWGSA
jgi:signal transduction histidine kinase